ncbi:MULTISPECIES: transcriptional regulator SplA domain-containing protein [Bacillaceae]|jgi:transcriptional regulator of the spore photoproduct lyase operon|uniref:transcriptional regulator SplA domain-containing protein n=1 Tax=Bacillaceae TaxID=186817 RepID=UPI000A2AE29A|nr:MULTISPECIES: transcriptional regulator SplA domain-containing protein [unclassified Bacillus (in: firmicutes)]PGY14197.1 transcriptional regulator [Bacillus sp. AFS031507]SMQ82068.1 transcriptional regulator of the spore photoproduct lyase operon [Bacillus sp. OV166]
MGMIEIANAKPGDEVYIIYRNPTFLTAANIKAAEIVQHPNNPDNLALYLNEKFLDLEEDDALFSSSDAAKKAYDTHFFDFGE